jgi:hypothetical protein
MITGVSQVNDYPAERAVRATLVERAIDDFETRTLAHMPGRFCRLIYLASLRDHNTGRYYHHGLEDRYGGEAAEEGLRQCHIQIFEELMALPLKARTQDLVGFFTSLKEERPRLVEAWERLRSYHILPPENCHPLARDLFCKDTEIILKVLRKTELWELVHEPHGHTDDLT